MTQKIKKGKITDYKNFGSLSENTCTRVRIQQSYQYKKTNRFTFFIMVSFTLESREKYSFL